MEDTIRPYHYDVLFMMNKDYFKELDKLAKGLKERGCDYKFGKKLDGGIILVNLVKDGSTFEWDAVCHCGSYGHEDGLLEVLDYSHRMLSYNEDTDDYVDDVEGWLTAEEVLKRWDKLLNNVSKEETKND